MSTIPTEAHFIEFELVLNIHGITGCGLARIIPVYDNDGSDSLSLRGHNEKHDSKQSPYTRLPHVFFLSLTPLKILERSPTTQNQSK
jgi:hypothetical protein